MQYGTGAHIEAVPQDDLAIWFEVRAGSAYTMDKLTNAPQSLATQTLIYFLGTGMMRLSIVAFLPRLSQDSTYLKTLSELKSQADS